MDRWLENPYDLGQKILRESMFGYILEVYSLHLRLLSFHVTFKMGQRLHAIQWCGTFGIELCRRHSVNNRTLIYVVGHDHDICGWHLAILFMI